MTPIRRLAAILAADVAGYSRLMGADEEGTLERLKALRSELLDPKIAGHLLQSIQDDPGFPPAYRALASCYAQMGRLDEARAIVARLRAITPQVVPSVLPWRNPEDRELYLSGLRLAAEEAG
jgi:hypothetical protein